MRCRAFARRSARPRAFGAAVLCGAAFASCGSQSPQETGRAAAAPGPAGGVIVIDRPVDGSRLRAGESAPGMLRLRASVRGSAPAGRPVFLRASCRPRACAGRAVAGADGRWGLRMTLTTTPAARFVTIDATTGRTSASPGAVTTIEVLPPRRSPTAARSRADRRARPDPSPRASADAAPSGGAERTPRSRTLPHEVLVIGDSLAIGMAPSLRAALPGWRVDVDARISRPLADGMRILAAQRAAPAIVAFSLFTNDDPSATTQLAQAVRATATRPGGCAVWATIARPPFNGVSYGAANELLARLAADPALGGGLQLVDWASLVARDPALVAGDGVHGTPAGYRARGRLYADAIRACAGEA